MDQLYIPKILLPRDSDPYFIIDHTLFAQEKENTLDYLKVLGMSLSDLSKDYPDFVKWYTDKIIPGIEKGEREIIVRHQSGRVLGIAILKDTSPMKDIPEESNERSTVLNEPGSSIAIEQSETPSGNERKICCLRVLPEYQNRGIGVKLFIRSMDRLETDKPLLSISSNNLNRFKNIMDYLNFKQYQHYPDLYRKNSEEISYNGYLI
jgi:hypothetical protein